MHSIWSILPAASIACEPQPAAQAWQVWHSALRFRPNKRNLPGIASPAPSGQIYLQYGRSLKKDQPRMAPMNNQNGHVRFHTPTRKVVLNGSISASFSAVSIEKKDTPSRPRKMPYFSQRSLSCSGFGSSFWKRFRPSRLPALSASCCSEPNGQSQPQNTPRPHTSTVMMMNHQKMKMNGSDRNSSHFHWLISEWNHVITWVMLGCAFR